MTNFQHLPILHGRVLDVSRREGVGQGSLGSFVGVPPLGQVDGRAHIDGDHLEDQN